MLRSSSFFQLILFFDGTATTEIYTLSYTTLFRSQRNGDAAGRSGEHRDRDRRRRASGARAVAGAGRAGGNGRSEEHTSELQSRLHLVCRLLLEKKKKKKTKFNQQSIKRDSGYTIH